MIRISLASLALLFAATVSAPVARADFSAAGDFSPTNNPNAVWSYGSEASLSGSLTLFHTLQTSQGNSSGPGTLDILTASGFNQQAAIFDNGSSELYHSSDPGTGFAPGTLAIEAGTSLDGLMRFTAPATGLYNLTTSFFGITIDTAEVFVVLDGTTLFSATHSGYGAGNADNFSDQLMLNEGDTLDFVVGSGPNGNSYDYVGLNAVLSPQSIPEPASVVMLVSGVSGVIVFAKRRKRLA